MCVCVCAVSAQQGTTLLNELKPKYEAAAGALRSGLCLSRLYVAVCKQSVVYTSLHLRVGVYWRWQPGPTGRGFSRVFIFLAHMEDFKDIQLS